MTALLSLRNLEVRYPFAGGELAAVRELSLDVARGECLGIVGESGAGKSQAMLAPLGLLPATARISGEVRFLDVDLLRCPARELDRIRGARIGMVFQDPLTALAPHLKIGRQIGEVLERHRGFGRAAASTQAVSLLEQVRMSDPARRARQYPHELSGGMRQRATIAMALACEPDLLIADEPTTALDVTVQAEILALLAHLQRERSMSLVLITHDLGVVAGLADRVAVMYAGRLVELAPTETLLRSPHHPYTEALLAAMPGLDDVAGDASPGIPGSPPDPRAPPGGCAFHPRCSRVLERCEDERPALVTLGERAVACHAPCEGAA